MKKIEYTLLLLAVAVLLLAGCVPPGTVEAPVETEEPVEPVVRCIDFSGYLSSQSLGQSFSLDGFQFSALGVGDLLVNVVSPGSAHLSFDVDGVRIDFQGPTSEVTLIAGAMSMDPLQIRAKDSNDDTVYGATIPAGYDQVDVELGGMEYDSIITHIDMTGGTGEGLLYEICWLGQ